MPAKQTLGGIEPRIDRNETIVRGADLSGEKELTIRKDVKNGDEMAKFYLKRIAESSTHTKRFTLLAYLLA